MMSTTTNGTTITVPLCAECNKINIHSINNEGEALLYYKTDTDNCVLCFECCTDGFQEITCSTCNRNLKNLKTVTSNKSIITENTKDVKWYCNDDCKEDNN